MRRLLIRIKQKAANDSFRSTLFLAGGGSIAQLVSVLMLPVLSRIYTPSDFEYLAIFISILSIISVFACLKYEMAIPVSKSDREARELLRLCFELAAIVAIISGLALYMISFSIERIEGLWVWIVIGSFLIGIYNALSYYYVKNKEFIILSKNRVLQSAVGNAVQFSGVAFPGSIFTLVAGHVLKGGGGALGLAYLFISRRWLRTRIVWSNKKRKLLMLKYANFPRYTLVESLANTAGLQLPILAIALLQGGGESGYLLMAMQLLAAPVTLIGGAVSQVYLSHAAEKKSNLDLKAYTEEVCGNLLRYGFGPILFIGICSPFLMPKLLGNDWVRTGEIALWICPWMAMRFVSSPISMVMHIRGQQKSLMVLTVAGFFIRFGVVAFWALFREHQYTEVYALSSFTFYVLCFFWFLGTAGLSIRDILKLFDKSFFLVFFICVAAGGTVFAMGGL